MCMDDSHRSACGLIREAVSSQEDPSSLDTMSLGYDVMSHPRLVNTSQLPLIHIPACDRDWSRTKRDMRTGQPPPTRDFTAGNEPREERERGESGPVA